MGISENSVGSNVDACLGKRVQESRLSVDLLGINHLKLHSAWGLVKTLWGECFVPAWEKEFRSLGFPLFIGELSLAGENQKLAVI